MSPSRFFDPSKVNPELLAMCPPVGQEGKLVVWRGKRYFLSRQYCPDGKVYVAKLNYWRERRG